MDEIRCILVLLPLVKGKRFQNHECRHVCKTYDIDRHSSTVEQLSTDLFFLIPVVHDSGVFNGEC
ncbi:hypothetical protein SAMN03159290_06185 [Pseudomonas sp. NFACC13-1]|nr:hypothetical protein SAMN03159290_06185 [Pseudomonas sp. NFACC13-1]